MSLFENIRVDVADNGALSYDAALVFFLPWCMSFNRPSRIEEYRSTQYDYTGAHVSLNFPCGLLFADRIGEKLHYTFTGDRIGSVSKLTGPPAFDCDDYWQYVSQIDIESCLSRESFDLKIVGRLAGDGGARSMRSFSIVLSSSIIELTAALDLTLRGRIERIFGIA